MAFLQFRKYYSRSHRNITIKLFELRVIFFFWVWYLHLKFISLQLHYFISWFSYETRFDGKYCFENCCSLKNFGFTTSVLHFTYLSIYLFLYIFGLIHGFFASNISCRMFRDIQLGEFYYVCEFGTQELILDFINFKKHLGIVECFFSITFFLGYVEL